MSQYLSGILLRFYWDLFNFFNIKGLFWYFILEYLPYLCNKNNYNIKKLNAYLLDLQYNTKECPICYDKFDNSYCNFFAMYNIKMPQILLQCGHRYCKQCINEWELYSDRPNLFNIYNCPICSNSYSSLNKWDYNHYYDFMNINIPNNN